MLLSAIVFAGLLTASAGSGVVAGLVASWRKSKAIEALAATLPEHTERAEPVPEAATPFRSPASVEREERRPRRVGKLHRHDYDLMIGRTLMR